MSIQNKSIPLKKTIVKTSPRTSSKPKQKARRSRKESTRFKTLDIPLPNGTGEVWAANAHERDVILSETYKFLAEHSDTPLNRSNFCEKEPIPIEYDSEESYDEPFNFFDETVDTLVEQTTNTFIKRFSEIHPFPLETPLIGGARKKKIVARTKRKDGKNKQSSRGRYDPPKAMVPRNLLGNDIMPLRKRPIFNFIDPNMQIAAPTQSFVVKAFKINSLYDPDPALLSTGYAGFAQLMVFYEYYRVNKIEVIWKPTNNESFSINVGFVFSQRDLTGTITTRQLALDALENGLSTGIDTLQQRNGGRSNGTYKRAIECASLLADASLYNGDISYTGTLTTDPADLLWVNLIVTSPANLTLLLNGAVGALRLRAHSDLFGRIVQDDTAFCKKVANYAAFKDRIWREHNKPIDTHALAQRTAWQEKNSF